MATGAQPAPTAVLAGQTLPWLLLRAWAVITVLATFALAIAWWRQRDHVRDMRPTLGLLLLAGMIFLPWALEWGLLR
ncbi:hypothetical protein KO481_33160 [Nocardia sp. NEAU-G5]|uniref:Uncharacterized protein n=1 Tax=Nocardia albiluteola TaxID=2842303 RepID=A0ABS6B7R5_9NOCA|nr:hypothetical protein [Nocardia albiluteola]MBU3066357.1 hypothetical protein [Nocardia albiluteola]